MTMTMETVPLHTATRIDLRDVEYDVGRIKRMAGELRSVR